MLFGDFAAFFLFLFLRRHDCCAGCKRVLDGGGAVFAAQSASIVFSD